MLTDDTPEFAKGNSRILVSPVSPLSGDDGDRTHDLRLAKPALYQLSYIPEAMPSYQSNSSLRTVTSYRTFTLAIDSK